MANTTLNLRYYMNGGDKCTFHNHQSLIDDQIDFIATNLLSDCRKLRFNHTELTDIGVSHIAINLLLRGGNRSNNLTHLSLNCACVTDEGVKSICSALLGNKNNKLQSLRLELNEKITCIGAQALGKMLEKMNHGNLQLLDLSYTMIGRDGVYVLCKSLLQNSNTKLTQLDVTGTLTLKDKMEDEDLKDIIDRTNNSRLEIIHY